jgi:hypothetical protein
VALTLHTFLRIFSFNVPAGTPSIPADGFRTFPQFLQANSEIVP